MSNIEKLTDTLNSSSPFFKRKALKKLLKLQKTNSELVPCQKNIIPIHFASSKNYSLYSPTMCAYIAYRSGAFGVGVNDYATLSYMQEFKRACKILNLPYTCGFRVDCKPILNGDKTVLYSYGIPVEKERAYFEILQNVRKQKFDSSLDLIDKVNSQLNGQGIIIDKNLLIKEAKKRDYLLTEKHVAKNLAEVIVKTFGKGKGLLDFIGEYMGIVSCEGETRFLKESENMYFTEDLAKVIYLNYLKPIIKEDLSNAQDFIKLNDSLGVISSIGLVLDNFDEQELSKVVVKLKEYGFNCVTIRNKLLKEEEYVKIVKFFESHEILTISLYGIGLPRQIVPTNEMEIEFKNSLAIIGNAVSVACDSKDGIFKKETISKCPNFSKRVDLFASIGRREI